MARVRHVHPWRRVARRVARAEAARRGSCARHRGGAHPAQRRHSALDGPFSAWALLWLSTMQALSSLIREHQFIARLVAALESYSRRVKHGLDANPADLLAFARAFSQFADELHHEKEERILLPFLARHGFDWNRSPLPLVRAEHRHERDLLEVLIQAGERVTHWSSEERRHVSAIAEALCELQRKHHRTENEILFREVAARLDGEALRHLHAELEAFDAQPSHAERFTAAVALGEALIARYAVLDSAPA
jgi:hemerythrin-like domain-containing protein